MHDTPTASAVPAADPSPQAIAVKELMARCMGNLQFAQRIVAKFQARLEDDLAELEKALRQGDAVVIARIAHRIKGAAANVAARGLQTRAADLEEQALAHTLQEAEALLAALRNEQARFTQSAIELGASPAACW